MTSRNRGDAWLYFVRPVGEIGPIKIGFASSPKARLRQLMEWSPVRLEIVATCPGDLALERNVHECFLDCHAHAEWFHAEPHLLAAIDAIKGGTPLAEAVDLTNRKGSIRKAKLAACAARKGTSEETVSL